MDQTNDLHELLQWYHDAGVDLALEAAPVARFAESARIAEAQATKRAAKQPTKGKASATAPGPAAQPLAAGKQTKPVTQSRTAAPAVVQNSEVVANARALADQAQTLEALKTAIEGFEGCNLKFTAKSTVFASGNPRARLMLVGEAPRREEDAQGVPFVGRAGQKLDKRSAMIAATSTSPMSCRGVHPATARRPLRRAKFADRFWKSTSRL